MSKWKKAKRKIHPPSENWHKFRSASEKHQFLISNGILRDRKDFVQTPVQVSFRLSGVTCKLLGYDTGKYGVIEKRGEPSRIPFAELKITWAREQETMPKPSSLKVHKEKENSVNDATAKLNRLLKLNFHDDYTAIDIETNGLDLDQVKIIEIAGIRVRGGEMGESYSTLVQCEEQLSDFITEMTGITNADLIGQPTIDEVLPEFFRFIGDDRVLGQEVSFDIKWLNIARERAGMEGSMKNHQTNLRHVAQMFDLPCKSYSLQNIRSALGLPETNAHRAFCDCLTTIAVYERLKACQQVYKMQFCAGDAKDFTARADSDALEQLEIPKEPDMDHWLMLRKSG